ncbi:hypothetical protein [Nitrincola sp.]|uniref:hypothetical protein n=1 Tax=Nitrincola sp. TaxID=1926584 RepID=UPI003A912000
MNITSFFKKPSDKDTKSVWNTMSLSRFVVFIAVVATSFSSVAVENKGEEDSVIQVVTEYMEAYSKSEFDRAATLVHPQHLSDYEQYTLPILIEAKNDPWSAKHPIVEVFFEGVPDDKIHKLTGTQVSAYIDRAMVTYLPAILDSARLENISVKSVIFLNESHARIHYDLSHNGEKSAIEEDFAKHEGEWRILLPVTPKQAAEHLQSVFQ